MATKKRRKRRRVLGDSIGPATARLDSLRSGVRGLRQALDRGACNDAFALLTETERTVGKLTGTPGLDNERAYFSIEKGRFKKACLR